MMRYTVVALFLGLLVALAHAGPAGRVVGGTDAPDGAYPYMAFLKRNGDFVCGASILNKNWLLTAAHCFKVLSTHVRSTVVVGTNNRLSGGDEYTVKYIVRHPKFSNPDGQFKNDIALLQVSEEIQFNEKVKPIALPANKLENYENKVAKLSGWGALKVFEDIPEALQHINLTIYNQEKCIMAWHRISIEKNVDDRNICTFTKRGEGVCLGDSGGPLVIDGIQVGITSYAVPCAKGYPDVFSRVSSFLDWISEYTTYETNA